MRNEIVVGCVSGVLIPEAELSSGTLITAQLGLEYGRNIYAIPGDIDRKQSEGTNMLIATGQAKCTRSSADVLEDFHELQGVSKEGFHPILREKQDFEDKTDQEICELLRTHPQSADEIVQALDADREDIIMKLSLLEISGYIELDMLGRYQVK